MLKEYFDRNSSPTSVYVVSNAPPNESVEEDFESETKESNFTKFRPKAATFVYNRKRTT